MSDEKEITYLGDVQRLCLKPGDIVVLSLDERLRDDDREHMRAVLEQKFPGNTVLVLDGGIKLGIVGAD